MTLMIILFAYFFSMSPIFASDCPKIEWMELSDGHVLIECGEQLYSILKLEGHEYVMQLIDHSPTCPCLNEVD
jgi:hypothetical protein